MIKYFLVFVLFCSTCCAKDYTFHGKWNTGGRRSLSGEMTCVVTPLKKVKDKQRWKGRFYGIWQGVEFDYVREFEGPADKLVGKAVVDGANYDWKGKINQKRFVATFTGDRYTGGFELKRVEENTSRLSR